MKKVLSLVVVIGMILSSLTFVSAGTFTDVSADNAKLQEAVELLAALGISNGYELADGSREYRPENTLKRCELVKLLVVALGYGELAEGSVPSFTDCQNHWAKGYISIAEDLRIVEGNGSGKFKPEDKVTFDGVITMFLRALKYTNANLNGGNDVYNKSAYVLRAFDLGLTKVVKYVGKAPATRGDVALMLQQLLQCKLVNTVEKTYKESTEILLAKVATEKTNVTVDEELVKKNPVLADYLYQNVNYYADDNGVAVYVAKSNSKVLEGTIVSANATKVKLNYSRTKADLELNVAATNVKFNNKAVAYTDVKADLVDASAKVVYDKDNNLLGILARKVTDDIFVSRVYRNRSTKLQSIQLPVKSGKVNLDAVTVKGAVSDIFDIAKGDVVKAYQSNDKSLCELFVVRDSVEGVVTRKSGSKFYVDALGDYVSNLSGATLEVGSKGTFYLDEDGNIYSFVRAAQAAIESDYAMVVKQTAGCKVGNVVIKDPTITVLNAAGEKVVYKLSEGAQIKDGSTTNAAVTTSSNNLTVNVSLNTIVKSVEKDPNNKELVKTVNVANTVAETVDTHSRRFYTSNDLVIYNIMGQNVAIRTLEQLKACRNITSANFKAIKDANGDYAVIVITDGKDSNGKDFQLVKNVKQYAWITKVETVLNADGNKVYELTALVDGEEKTFETTKTSNFTTAPAANCGLVEFELNGDVVVAIGNPDPAAEVVINPVSGNSAITYNSSRGYVTYNGKTVYVSEDCAVYVLDSKEKFSYIGSLNDVTLLNTDVRIYIQGGEVTEIVIKDNQK